MFSEVNNYIDRIEKKFENHMRIERFRYRFFLKNLEYFYYMTTYISDQKSEAKGENSILFSVYNKAALDLYGIFNCLNSGLEIQASILLRSLFENFIDVLIIFEDESQIPSRINLFSNFSHIKRWKHIDEIFEANKKYSSISQVLEEKEISSYHNLYEKFKMNYQFDKLNPHWAGKVFETKFGKNKNVNLYNICEYFGEHCLEEYLRVYTSLSISVHNSPALREHFQKDGSIYNAPQFSSSIIDISVIAIDYCQNIIYPILEFLKPLNHKEYLKSLVDFKIYYINMSTVITKLNEFNKQNPDLGFNSQENDALNLDFFEHLRSYLPLKLLMLEKEFDSKSKEDKAYFSFLRIYIYSIFENLFLVYMVLTSRNKMDFHFKEITIYKFFHNHLPSFSMLIMHLLTCRDLIQVLMYGFNNKSEVYTNLNKVIKHGTRHKDFKNEIKSFTGIPNYIANEFIGTNRFRNFFAHRMRIPWIIGSNNQAFYERNLFEKIKNDDKSYINNLNTIIEDTKKYENSLRLLKPEELISSIEIIEDLYKQIFTFFNELLKELENKLEPNT